MPLVKVPFNAPPDQHLDAIAIGEHTTFRMNNYLDKAPSGPVVTIARPGFIKWLNLGTTDRVDGIFWWEEMSIRIAVSNGNVYKIDVNGNSSLIGSGLRPGTIVSFRPYYNVTDNTNYLFMANGGPIYYTNGATVNVMQDENAPVYVTHLDVIDTILIANDSANHVMRYSQPLGTDNGVFSWPAVNSIRPDTLGDTMQALMIGSRYIYLFGKSTTDIFWSTNDQLLPFQRVDGMFNDIGVQAIYSIAKLETPPDWMNRNMSLIFLDQRRYVMSLNGNVSHWISKQIDKDIQAMKTVSDAIGDVVKINSKMFYFLRFPSENRSFLYDFELQYWSEIGVWDETLAAYNSFPWTDVAYDQETGQWLMASSNDDSIFILDNKYVDDDGRPLMVEIITGHVDHGTFNYKRCKWLTFHVKRGFNNISSGRILDEQGNVVTDQSGNPLVQDMTLDQANALCNLQIQFQDTDMKEWSPPYTASISNYGVDNSIFRLNGLGTFRERQYRLRYSGPTKFILVDCEANVDMNTR